LGEGSKQVLEGASDRCFVGDFVSMIGVKFLVVVVDGFSLRRCELHCNPVPLRFLTN
jgi:hypothetical protein